MKNENIDINYFKEKLEKEEERVLSELKTIGRINPDNPQDWEATPGEKDDGTADPNDFADSIEEYEENTAILKQLEIELNNIKKALKKIEDGSYGICEVSGEPIEKERLEANPSAKTCLKYTQ